MLTYSWMTLSDSFLYYHSRIKVYCISFLVTVGFFYYIVHRSPDCTKAPVIKPYMKDNLCVKKLVP